MWFVPPSPFELQVLAFFACRIQTSIATKIFAKNFVGCFVAETFFWGVRSVIGPPAFFVGYLVGKRRVSLRFFFVAIAIAAAVLGLLAWMIRG